MIEAVIFGLEGVLVSNDEYHFQAWKQMTREQGIGYDRAMHEKIRWLSRQESLNIILRGAKRRYTEAEKFALAARKNDLYTAAVNRMDENSILPGVLPFIAYLREHGVKTAVASSSENATGILRHLNMRSLFDAVADGNSIERIKPAPDVFLLAADKLRLPPASCLAVEETPVGAQAARAAGMRLLALGTAARQYDADYAAPDLSDFRRIEQSLRPALLNKEDSYA